MHDVYVCHTCTISETMYKLIPGFLRKGTGAFALFLVPVKYLLLPVLFSMHGSKPYFIGYLRTELLGSVACTCNPSTEEGAAGGP